jgi:hypothetical protein
MRKLLVVLLVAVMAQPVMDLSAATFKGVTMSDTLEVEGQKLVLNGMALRKKIIFKVYVAGLYLPAKEKSAKKILAADQPRHIIMHFVRGVGAGKINDAWIEGLEDNTPKYSPELKKQFDTLCAYMEDVEDGDQIVFSYLPEMGTKVKVKGKLKGTIPGKAFADALFACWIGPEPGPGEGFKEDLLGIE